MLSPVALKMIKGFISPELIKEVADKIIEKAIEEKNKIEIDPLKDEVDAAALIYEVKGKVIFTVAILSSEDKIVRFENTLELDKLIQLILKQM